MSRKGKSICASAKAYGISEATLRSRFKMQEEGKTLVESRRKIAIGEQQKKYQQIALKLCVMWVLVPHYTRLNKFCKNMLNKLLLKIIDQVKNGLKVL